MRIIERAQAKGNPPVDIQWMKDGSAVEAVSCVAQILARMEDKDDPFPDLTMRTLSIRIEVDEADLVEEGSNE